MFNLGSIQENNTFWQVQKNSLGFEVSLKELASFKIGGCAEALYSPCDTEELSRAVNFFCRCRIPMSVIGGCTNLLISDKGIKGVVLSLNKMNKIEIENICGDDIYIRAGAGALTASLTEFAAANGISGLEAFGGLPGTVGGACFMNARCYGKSVADIIVSAQSLKLSCGSVPEAQISEEIFNAADWDYKKSPFQANAEGITLSQGRKIVISALFKLKKGNSDKIFIETQAAIADRVTKGHFKFPSAGSVFKNNHSFGHPSGKLIDEAGLCGLTEGGAQIAPWHGNFIINKGNASSEDVKKLIKTVQESVLEKYGFILEPEIIFAGG